LVREKIQKGIPKLLPIMLQLVGGC